MNLRADIETDFTVYDGRRHVLGASMLAAMDKALRQASGVDETMPFHIKRAKFMRKTGCNGVLHIAPGGTPSAGFEDAAAHVWGLIGEHAVEAWFVPDTDRPVEQERPSAHNISEIAPTEEFSGSCSARADGLESALCLIVDANKLVQLAGHGVHRNFGDAQPVTELVYLEDLTIDAALERVDGLLRLESMASREGGGRLFTLNRLIIGAGATPEILARVALSFHAQ